MKVCKGLAGEETFAGTRSNGSLAPLAAVRGTELNRLSDNSSAMPEINPVAVGE